MKYQDYILLGFSLEKTELGVKIRSHLKPVADHDEILTQGIFVCDFLTGDNPVPVSKRPDTSTKLLTQSTHLKTLVRYATVFSVIRDLIIANGDNEEIFGPGVNQELLIDFSSTYRVGLLIGNNKLLDALKAPVAGIDEFGEIITQGTVISFDNLLKFSIEQVDKAIASLTDDIRAHAQEQWESVTKDIIAFCKAYFTGNVKSEEYLDCEGVCRYLGVSRTSLNRYRDGKVPSGFDVFPKPDSWMGRSPLWKAISLLIWKRSKT